MSDYLGLTCQRPRRNGSTILYLYTLGLPSSLAHRTSSLSTGRTVDKITVLYLFHSKSKNLFSCHIIVDDQESWKLHDFQCRVHEITHHIWIKEPLTECKPSNLNKTSERTVIEYSGQQVPFEITPCLC